MKRDNREYLLFIRSLPCIVCGDDSEPHHLRSRMLFPIEFAGGTGLKPHDCLSIPLCRCHHRECEESYIDFSYNYNISLQKEVIKCLISYIYRRENE